MGGVEVDRAPLTSNKRHARGEQAEQGIGRMFTEGEVSKYKETCVLGVYTRCSRIHQQDSRNGRVLACECAPSRLWPVSSVVRLKRSRGAGLDRKTGVSTRFSQLEAGSLAG